MWKVAVEKLLEEQHRSTLKKLAALNISELEDVQQATGLDENGRCEAIIAKGKRENLRCNARAQKDSTRCKTHSKNKAIVRQQVPTVPDTFPIALVSSLEPDVVFGVKNEDGSVMLEVPDKLENLF
jgi:hypothetical protein